MSSVTDIKVWRDAHPRNAGLQESAAEALSCCMACGSKLFRIPGTQAMAKRGRWIRIMQGLFMRTRKPVEPRRARR
jgi:hypothetical protein